MRRTFFSCLLVLLAVDFAAADIPSVRRREIERDAFAEVTRGRQRIGLQVTPPSGPGRQRFLQNFLETPSDWDRYKNVKTFFIQFQELKAETQRRVLLALYSDDIVDEEGWKHVVVDDGELLITLCEWLTGSGRHVDEVVSDPRNDLSSNRLRKDQEVLIPFDLLLSAMKRPTSERIVEPPRAKLLSRGELEYGTNESGKFAVYRLKPGETLFSSVVLRFTDLLETEDVLEAARQIQRRSNIGDVTDIADGQKIIIPLEMLSDRYMPEGSEDKKHGNEPLIEAKSRDLSDVVVILDPGHGGSDPGSMYGSGLIEDEINYDIVCRIKKKLEDTTDATVHVTVRDISQGYTPTNRTRFERDTDEVLLTHPPYRMTDNKIAVNLRYMLANSLYQSALDRGVDSDKVVFVSIHTDSLTKAHRGTMIYIPGARYRRNIEKRGDRVYRQYLEGREFNVFTSTPQERRRDEAMSRDFATLVMSEFGRHRVKRSDNGNPIRSQIRYAGKRPMVPGVIRNSHIPTKILIETANIENATDRARLADPNWRQMVADAYVSALLVHFGNSPKIRTAQAP